jgi:hypothetical protein
LIDVYLGREIEFIEEIEGKLLQKSSSVEKNFLNLKKPL